MGNKIKLNFVFLIIGFMISACTISIAISSVYPFYKIIVQKNNFYSEYNLINIYDDKSKLNFKKMISTLESKNVDQYMLTPMNIEIINDEGYIMSDVFVIPKSFDYSKKINIKNKTDNFDKFNDGNNYAIIGENFNDFIFSKGDKEYIKVLEKDYEIVGVIEDNEFLASSIMVSCEVDEFINREIGSFNILVKKEETDKLRPLLDEGYKVNGNEIKEEPISEVLKQIPLELEKRAYELGVGILNLIVFSYFFSNSIKKNVAIKRVLGASNRYVLKDIFKDIVVISTIGTILGIGMSSVIVQIMNNTNTMAYGEINTMGIILTVLTVFIISLIVVFLVLLNVIRFKIMKEIR